MALDTEHIFQRAWYYYLQRGRDDSSFFDAMVNVVYSMQCMNAEVTELSMQAVTNHTV